MPGTNAGQTSIPRRALGMMPGGSLPIRKNLTAEIPGRIAALSPAQPG